MARQERGVNSRISAGDVVGRLSSMHAYMLQASDCRLMRSPSRACVGNAADWALHVRFLYATVRLDLGLVGACIFPHGKHGGLANVPREYYRQRCAASHNVVRGTREYPFVVHRTFRAPRVAIALNVSWASRPFCVVFVLV